MGSEVSEEFEIVNVIPLGSVMLPRSYVQCYLML